MRLTERRTALSEAPQAITVMVLVAVAAVVILLLRTTRDAGLVQTVTMGWELEALLLVLSATGLAAVAFQIHRHRTLLRRLDNAARAERSALALASLDPLTGLLNRRALEHFDQTGTAGPVARAVLVCDLDQFKAINDRLGHPTGDRVLRIFADRFRGSVPEGVEAHLVRLGGDEFMALLSCLDVKVQVDRFAEGLIDSLREPVEIDGRPVSISASIGVALVGAEGLAAALARADVAMYEAKRNGARYRMFEAGGDGTGWTGAQAQTMLSRRLVSHAHDPAAVFVGALGIDRFPLIRRAAGPRFGARVVRAVREALETGSRDILVERLAPDVIGIAFAADDRIAALERLETFRAAAEAVDAGADSGVTLTFTAGMAGPGPIGTLRELAEQAHVALDEARESGRRSRLYGEGTSPQSTGLALMRDLREALTQGCLQLHYQPKLDARSGAIDSYEALIRWDHPLRGEIAPSSFIPVAEQTGNIRLLTTWVVDQAIEDHRIFVDAGIGRKVFVNVSAQLIGDTEFAEHLVGRLGPLDGAIGIEITETAVLAQPDRALAHLQAVADAGISIAIDDYGVGMSSLVYLKQMPAHELKIDMMFIAELTRSHRDPMIVRSTIDLAHGLGMRVTAEGVDRPDTQALLQVMGCDLLQGYQIAKPMSRGELMRFMLEREDEGASANIVAPPHRVVLFKR